MHESDFHVMYSCYGQLILYDIIVFYLCIVIHLYEHFILSFPSPPPHLLVETLSSSKAKQSRKRLASNLEGNPTSAESDIEIQKAFVGKHDHNKWYVLLHRGSIIYILLQIKLLGNNVIIIFKVLHKHYCSHSLDRS